jgi:hypothetical protein
MIKFECCHVDTCLSDYWSGHHLPHVQIPVWRGMTLAQVKSALHSEVNEYVSGAGKLARAFSYDLSTDKEYTDQLHKAAHAAIDALELSDPMNDRCFMDVEEIDEDDDDCSDCTYAFFVFVEL